MRRIVKSHLPWNVIRCSLTLRFAPGLKASCNVVFYKSNAFFKGCNLSGDLCLLSLALYNPIMHKVFLNLFRAKIALKIGLPSSLLLYWWTGTPTNLYTQLSRKIVINFFSSSVASCFHLSLSFKFLSAVVYVQFFMKQWILKNSEIAEEMSYKIRKTYLAGPLFSHTMARMQSSPS